MYNCETLWNFICCLDFIVFRYKTFTDALDSVESTAWRLSRLSVFFQISRLPKHLEMIFIYNHESDIYLA